MSDRRHKALMASVDKKKRPSEVWIRPAMEEIRQAAAEANGEMREAFGDGAREYLRQAWNYAHLAYEVQVRVEKEARATARNLERLESGR